MNRPDIVNRLASLAYSRANLDKALNSAVACGQLDYFADNSPEFRRLDDECVDLKRKATESELREAREITNAPI